MAQVQLVRLQWVQSELQDDGVNGGVRLIMYSDVGVKKKSRGVEAAGSFSARKATRLKVCHTFFQNYILYSLSAHSLSAHPKEMEKIYIKAICTKKPL